MKKISDKVTNMLSKCYLEPFEICEFADSCKEFKDCKGKDPNRNTRFSCGLRRGLLICKE